MYLPTKVMQEKELIDGDWAKVSSPNGEITVPVAEMAALNENTIWTWNAIGKRRGAWALDPEAPEANKGFLLNHLISELLPPKGDGLRWSNSDPITGQAAWFDLRVRVEKTSPPKGTQPQFDTLTSPVGRGPKNIKQSSKGTS
jgi:anaerobic selenocysteine-containing dehydrogenase